MKIHGQVAIIIVVLLIVLPADTRGQRDRLTVIPNDFACSQVAALTSQLRESLGPNVSFSIVCQPTTEVKGSLLMSLQPTAAGEIQFSLLYNAVRLDVNLLETFPLFIDVLLSDSRQLHDLLINLLPSPLLTLQAASTDGCASIQIENTLHELSLCPQVQGDQLPRETLSSRQAYCGVMTDSGTLLFDSDSYCPNAFVAVADTIIITNGATIQGASVNLTASSLIIDQGGRAISYSDMIIDVDDFNGTNCHLHANGTLYINSIFDFRALHCTFEADDTIALEGGGDLTLETTLFSSNSSLEVDARDVVLSQSVWHADLGLDVTVFLLEMDNSTLKGGSISIVAEFNLPPPLLQRIPITNHVFLSDSHIVSYGSVSVSSADVDFTNSSLVEAIMNLSINAQSFTTSFSSLSCGSQMSIQADFGTLVTSMVESTEGAIAIDVQGGDMEGVIMSSLDSLQITAVDWHVTTTSMSSPYDMQWDIADTLTVNQVNITRVDTFLSSSWSAQGASWNVQANMIEIRSNTSSWCTNCTFTGSDIIMSGSTLTLVASWNATNLRLEAEMIGLQGSIVANESTTIASTTLLGDIMIDTGMLSASSVDGTGRLFLQNNQGVATFNGPVSVPVNASGVIQSNQAMDSIDASETLEIIATAGEAPLEIELITVDTTDNLTLKFPIQEVDYGHMILYDHRISGPVLLLFEMQTFPSEGQEFPLLSWNGTSSDLASYLVCADPFGSVSTVGDAACVVQNGYLVRVNSTDTTVEGLPDSFRTLVFAWYENLPSMTSTPTPSTSASSSVSPSSSSSPSPSASSSSSASTTATTSASPSGSASFTPTSTSSGTVTHSPSVPPSDTASTIPSATVTRSSSPSNSRSLTSSSTSSGTSSHSPSRSASMTTTMSVSISHSSSRTVNPSSTSMPSLSASISFSRSQSTSLFVPSPTSSTTPSGTSSRSLSASASSSPSHTVSPTSSVTVSSTRSLSITPSVDTSDYQPEHLQGPLEDATPSPRPSHSPSQARETPLPDVGLLPSRSELFALFGCGDCEYQSSQFTLTGTDRSITLVSRDGTPVVTLYIPAYLTTSGQGNIHIQFVRSRDGWSRNNGLSSPLVDITLLSLDRTEVTTLNRPLQICLEAELATNPVFCLAFFDVDTQSWKCEDLHLSRNSMGQHCGYTGHLTSFALLLGGETSGKSFFNSAISWISLGLLLGAIGVVFLSVGLIELRYIRQRQIQKQHFKGLEDSLRKQMGNSQ